MNDLLGKSFGPYVVTEKISEGGTAVIYRGYQESLNRYVAIKVLRGELAADEEFIARFRQEALAVAKLKHPNILTVYDAGRAHDVYYMVMDYVEGGSLADLIARNPLDLERAISIATQIADALEYAHRQGLIHRDVKPSNILLTLDGRPLLADFGTARVVYEDSRLTRTGTSIGTPEYMAPEQAQGQPSDARTDVYALGIVLYEMLSGDVPFTATTPMATLYKQVNEPLPPVRKVAPDTPSWLESVISRALAKQAEDRFQSAKEFVEALRARKVPKKSRRRATSPPTSLAGSVPQAQPHRGTGRFATRVVKGTARASWKLVSLLLRALTVLLVALLILAIMGAIGGAYFVGGLAERAIPTYAWSLEDVRYFDEFAITKAELDEAAELAVLPYVLDMIDTIAFDLQPPTTVGIVATASNTNLYLQGRLVLLDGVPQIYIERLNGIPLYVVGGIVSNGVNRGLENLFHQTSARLDVLQVGTKGIAVRFEGGLPVAASGPTAISTPTPTPSSSVILTPTATTQPVGLLTMINEMDKPLVIDLAGNRWWIAAGKSMEMDLPVGSYTYTVTVEATDYLPKPDTITIGEGNTILRISEETEMAAGAEPTATRAAPPKSVGPTATSRPKATTKATRAPDCPDARARITSPGIDAEVRGGVEVWGSASIPDFDYYKLEFGKGYRPSTWSLIGDLQQDPVSDGLLGVWDSSPFARGVYTLRLVVVDRTGNYKECQTRVKK